MLMGLMHIACHGGPGDYRKRNYGDFEGSLTGGVEHCARCRNRKIPTYPTSKGGTIEKGLLKSLGSHPGYGGDS
jgi:hypothetical protein